jgi:hypothetical protein
MLSSGRDTFPAAQEDRVMANVNIPVQLAPETLDQPILPGWQFSLFSVNLGDSSDADVEKQAIQRVGSYGKQIGHLAEALEVVIDHFKLLDVIEDQKKRDALTIFLSDVAKARECKPAKAKQS